MVPSLLGNLSDVAAALQGAAGELRSGNELILQSLSGESSASIAAARHLTLVKPLWASDGSSSS